MSAAFFSKLGAGEQVGDEEGPHSPHPQRPTAAALSAAAKAAAADGNNGDSFSPDFAGSVGGGGDDGAGSSVSSPAATSLSLARSGSRSRVSSGASVAIKLKVRHQREVKRLFTHAMQEMETQESEARSQMEGVMLVDGLRRLHRDFVREKQVFIEHSQSRTVYQEMVARHQLVQTWEEEFTLLYKFVDARLLPVKMEALQVRCLQVQAWMWVSQGFERAQLLDMGRVWGEEAAAWRRLMSMGRWLHSLYALARETFTARRIPHVLHGRKISNADCALIRHEWEWHGALVRIETLREQRAEVAMRTMVDDLLLMHGAERIRLEWEEQEAGQQLQHSGRSLRAALRRGR